MKKAFTLLELLVVVVVIAILMSISFKIMGAASDDTERNETILKMQAVQNAIEGYYAVYGSYPPVPLCGSRNIYQPINTTTYMQDMSRTPSVGAINSDQIEAACRSQPVAMRFPYSAESQGSLEQLNQRVQDSLTSAKGNKAEFKQAKNNALLCQGFVTVLDTATLSGSKDKVDFNDVQLFQMGLMSFLLPRYLLMMKSNDQNDYDTFAQWKNLNQLPCDFETGTPYASWKRIAQAIKKNGSQYQNPESALKVALLPSQVVCTRWVSCLEEMVHSDALGASGDSPDITVYGVKLNDGTASRLSQSGATAPGVMLPLYMSPGGEVYPLDCLTIMDSWNAEMYYYSPPPHQSYVFWSGGEDNYTAPPWMTEEDLDATGAGDQLRGWKSDDIVDMKL